MLEIDVIRNIAREVLIIKCPKGFLIEFLWDRTLRIARNIDFICKMPDITKLGFQIDRPAITIAAYFSDIGLARHLEQTQTFVIPTSMLHNQNIIDDSVEFVETRLHGMLEPLLIAKSKKIITESFKQNNITPDAMILSDARNLDDFGAIGIFNELQKYHTEGRGVTAAIEIWQKKIDYRYWLSRLDKDFRFNSVRKLAEKRLINAEYIMQKIKKENDCKDLEDFIQDTQQYNDTISKSF
jgi:hypothetical protein